MNGISCQLCAAVRDASQDDGPKQPENTIIARSPRFLLMPSVGPLVTGQALVVSTQHIPSLALMGAEAVAEYDQFVHEVVTHGDDWLEVEHGATESDCAGACVVHAHVHLLPGMSKYVASMDGAYEELYRGEGLQLPTTDTPYIFLRNSLRHFAVFDATGLPSQFIRHVICASEGWHTSDWRSVPRDHLLRETLAFWGVNQ